MDESERLVALAALAPPAEAVRAWTTWRETTEIADATALLTWAGGYVHRNLLAAGVDDPYLGGIYRYNLISNNRRVIAALPAIREIAAATTVTPLKSFGMSAETYSRGLRPLADFDFFVPMEQVARARELLQSRGFLPNLGISEQEFAGRVVPHRGSWNFVNDTKIDLDLHWRIFEHLDIAQNEALVADHSHPAETEFGTVRRLDNELMLLSLAVHHLHSSGPANGLFDFAHLLKVVDVAATARLTARIGIDREIREVCAAIRGIVGDRADPNLGELERLVGPRAASQPAHDATRRVLPPFDSAPRRYRETERIARPLAYRIWSRLGRPLWLERRLLGRSGTVTRAVSDPRPYAPGVPFYPRTSGTLGIGWHHLFPGDPHRWANYPDARVLFRDVVPGIHTVRIELDPEQWARAPRSTFNVFCNGRFVGSCDKSASGFEFVVTRPATTIEVSLRPKGFHRFRNPGSQSKWYRMLAPVRSLQLR